LEDDLSGKLFFCAVRQKARAPLAAMSVKNVFTS
jgi:hypothetical protein